VKVKQGRQDLLAEFQVQLRFLRRSAREFDNGDEDEAKRLAVVLRLLLHNTKQSHALLKQVGIQHQLKFLDTWTPPDKPTDPRILVKRWDAGLGVIAMDGQGARFKAPLADSPKQGIRGLQPFRLWWNQWVLQDMLGESFTRKELVLFVANQAGGAHVDPAIHTRFHALTRLNSLGWGWHREGENIALTVPASPGDQPMGSPIPVNIRQIVFEVDETLLRQAGHLAGRAEASARPEA
jgi:hypothetical protein